MEDELIESGDERLVDKLRPFTLGGSVFWLVTVTGVIAIVLGTQFESGWSLDLLIPVALAEGAVVAFVLRAAIRRHHRS